MRVSLGTRLPGAQCDTECHVQCRTVPGLCYMLGGGGGGGARVWCPRSDGYSRTGERATWATRAQFLLRSTWHTMVRFCCVREQKIKKRRVSSNEPFPYYGNSLLPPPPPFPSLLIIFRTVLITSLKMCTGIYFTVSQFLSNPTTISYSFGLSPLSPLSPLSSSPPPP